MASSSFSTAWRGDVSLAGADDAQKTNMKRTRKKIDFPREAISYDKLRVEDSKVAQNMRLQGL
jgi:hypothetical protein